MAQAAEGASSQGTSLSRSEDSRPSLVLAEAQPSRVTPQATLQLIQSMPWPRRTLYPTRQSIRGAVVDGAVCVLVIAPENMQRLRAISLDGEKQQQDLHSVSATSDFSLLPSPQNRHAFSVQSAEI